MGQNIRARKHCNFKLFTKCGFDLPIQNVRVYFQMKMHTFGKLVIFHLEGQLAA